MKYRLLTFFLPLLFISCQTETGNTPVPGSDNIADSDTVVEIPEHLQGLENLVAFPADSRPTHEVQLVRETDFGEIPPNTAPPVNTPSTAVDDENRVYIADRRLNRIQVFDQEGSQTGTLGRSGRGPGEFLEITSIREGNGQVFAKDPYQQVIHFYSAETLSLDQTLTLDPSSWLDHAEIIGISSPDIVHRNRDQLLVGEFQLHPEADTRFTGYYRLTRDGELDSGLLLKQRNREYISLSINSSGSAEQGAELPPPPPSTGHEIPLERKSLLDMSENGDFYSAWTEDFLIEVHNAEGAYERAIYYPVGKRPVDPEHFVEHYFRDETGYGPVIARAVRDADLPETWPVLNDLLIDDQQRLWVSTVTADDESFEWWVLENSGELIGQFTWPKKSRIEEIKNGYLYTRETNDEGIRQVVKYRITLSERSPDS